MTRPDDVPEAARAPRESLLGDVLRDLLVTTVGFLVAVAAVILAVGVLTPN